ncbi:MAG: ribonuclease P protein component [Pseudomonadota bacterium]
MTNPPKDQSADRADSPQADFSLPEVLKARADFLRAARGVKWGTKGLFLQGYDRGDEKPPRVGFTCSKKVGNAVARNRAKRRLREVARAILPSHAQSGWDYVLIGKAEVTATRGFEDLKKDLIYALGKIHAA